MSGISCLRDVRSALKTSGYCRLRADELRMTDEMREGWLSLSIDYSDLPADEYLPGGGKYRFRRYGRFSFSPESGALSRLPHEDYYQSPDINQVTGGFVRKFAPLLDTTFENPFLRELIRFDFSQFPLVAALSAGDWEVHAHLIRVKANESEPGQPTPEGIHRDGAEYVTVHLAELVNAGGGDVSIYDDDRNLLSTFRLEQVMDCYLFHDASLWHEAASIYPLAPAHEAIRSILTFDFHPPARRSGD